MEWFLDSSSVQFFEQNNHHRYLFMNSLLPISLEKSTYTNHQGRGRRVNNVDENEILRVLQTTLFQKIIVIENK